MRTMESEWWGGRADSRESPLSRIEIKSWSKPCRCLGEEHSRHREEQIKVPEIRTCLVIKDRKEASMARTE